MLPEEIADSPFKNVLTRSCGSAEEVEVDISFLKVEKGDLFILCSNGLTDLINDADLSNLLDGFENDLSGLCKALIDRANENEGNDNVTVILAKVEEV